MKSKIKSKQAVLDAIEGSGAIISKIARALDVGWHGAKALVEKWPETIQAMEDEQNRVLDMAESAILSSISTDKDLAAAKWYLSKKGKERGYGDSVAVTGADGGPIRTAGALDLTKLSNEELEVLLSLTKKAGG